MQSDKLKHFAVGAAAAVLCTAVPLLLGLWWFLALWLGIVAPVVLGWAKEQLYDKQRLGQHTVDGWDAYATAAGAVVAPVGLLVAAALSLLLQLLGGTQ